MATAKEAIDAFAVKQNEYNERMGTAITGVTGDVKSQDELIKKLQASAGDLPAEAQAILDELSANSAAAVEKVEALDALTAPAIPDDVLNPV